MRSSVFRAGITDLLSVLALPALWSGHKPAQIADTLLDVLLRLLRLDFAYVRLRDAMDGSPIELVRVAPPRHPAAQPRAVGQALSRWVTTEPCPAPCVIPNPVGPGEVSIARFRLGLEDAVGVVVAGAQRADFPTTIERLLGGVAANQAAIGLQEARRLRDQQRAAAALEQRVVERTTQLTAVNDALQLLTTRLLQLQDEERRRIARDLHDVTAQNLGAIAINLAHLRRVVTDLPPEAQTLVTESVALADDVLQHIRTLSYLLHPPCWINSGSPPPYAGISKASRNGAASTSISPSRRRSRGCPRTSRPRCFASCRRVSPISTAIPAVPAPGSR